MKGESNIDELFHQRLYNAEVPPPVEVWSKIDEEIREPRRHRLFLWILFLGLGTLGTAMWLSNTHRPTLAVQALPQNVIDTASAAQPGAVPQKDFAALTPSNTPTTDKHSPENTPSHALKNTPKGIATDPGIGTTLTIKPLPLPTTLQLGVEKNTSKDAPVLAQTGEAATASPLASAVTMGERPSLALSNQHTFLPPLDFIDLESTLEQPLTKTVRIVKKKKEQKKCYDFHKNSTAWFVDAYVGPSLAQKKLSTTPDNLPYLNKRLSTERRDWATFNLGLRATYVFKRHFLLRAGLHYDHSTEVFTFQELERIIFNVEYNVATGKNDTTGSTPIYRTTKTFNRFGMLELPVMAGFELRSGNMGVNINAGASMNLLFWKRGQILSPDNKLAWFTPSKDDLEVFRQRTGMSAMGSAQWFWHLHPHLRVYTELYFRQVLKPISVATHPIEQRHQAWGLNLGVTRILD